MGGIVQKGILKNIILYGEKGAGKTLFLYQLQSEMNLEKDKIKSTFGVNYEIYSVREVNLGIFDLSGDIQQYTLTNMITKAVDIHGIIFIVSLDNIDLLDESRDSLERIIGNNFINSPPSVYIIFNKKKNLERLDWIDNELLESRLGIPKLKKIYKIEVVSQICDISEIRNDGIDGFYKFKELLTKQ